MMDYIRQMNGSEFGSLLFVYSICIAAITMGFVTLFAQEQDKLIAKCITGTIKALRKRGMLKVKK